jgi:hypothetical protein
MKQGLKWGQLMKKKPEDKNLTLLSLQAVENPFIPHLMRAKNVSPAVDISIWT